MILRSRCELIDSSLIFRTLGEIKTMDEPSADEVRRANMIALASAHAIYVEAIREIAGEKGLEGVGEANRLHGLELGRNAIQSGELRMGDLSSIFDFFESAHPFFGFELEKMSESDDSLDIKVTYCPWIDTFRDEGARDDICTWVCKMDEGIGQAINSGVTMTLPMCMMRGDPYCIYHYEK